MSFIWDVEQNKPEVDQQMLTERGVDGWSDWRGKEEEGGTVSTFDDIRRADTVVELSVQETLKIQSPCL